MSMVVALPDDASLMATVDDPGAFVVAALDRAKSWLAQASMTDLPTIVETKARADAIRCYVAQKELGKDAELAATEIVRRAERRIGELIREGQEAGEIRQRGDNAASTSHVDAIGATEAAGVKYPSELTPIYSLADDVTDEQFEEAIDDAKGERNLSRANVVRKIKGSKERGATAADDPERLARIRELADTGRSSKQIAAALGHTDDYIRTLARRHDIEIAADKIVRNTRLIDSNRVVRELVAQVDVPTTSLDLIDYAALDRDELLTWISSLTASIKSLTTIKNKLTKELTQ